MARTITVKGIGKASATPDYVVLSFTLESQDKEYEPAMELAADHLEHLNRVLCDVGFEKEAVKTSDFSVQTKYDSVKDHNGNYRRVFRGYEVTHRLKLAFDFDSVLLAQTLSAVSRCISHPYLSVNFTVRDSTDINEEMLRSATANAKRKAEILCEASNTRLGNLVAIDYNWDELDLYSPTAYKCCDADYAMEAVPSIDITPDDINVSDTVTFVWELA